MADSADPVLFEIHDLGCVLASNADEAMEAIAREPIGVVIQDMNFTGDTTSGDEAGDHERQAGNFRRSQHDNVAAHEEFVDL